MTAFALRLFTSVCAALTLATVVRAAEPPIVAKARAFIGSEAALNNLKSVRFQGTLVTADPSDATKQTRAAMEIVFQKPHRQRITMTSDKSIEITALDGYDGWQRIQDAGDPSKWRQTLLGTEQIKRLRANAWENLAFFRGIEKVGGRVEEQGTKTIDGRTCQKVAFIHSPGIIFYRYFDVATGKLMFTETEAGGTIREQGEMVVDGIRFPRSIVTAMKNAAGETVTVTINFEKITLNEDLPDSLFAVPILAAK